MHLKTRWACKGLRGKQGARVLIGGLGLGFTLAATLKTLSLDAEVVVAEVVPAVVEWNRGLLGAFAGRPLDDPRTKIQAVDVTVLLEKERTGFDAIVLDVADARLESVAVLEARTIRGVSRPPTGRHAGNLVRGAGQGVHETTSGSGLWSRRGHGAGTRG